MPQPYNRTQLRALQATLDEGWPKLPREEAEKWLRGYPEGRSPYSRSLIKKTEPTRPL
jgi:hypothetical protein